MVKINKIYTKNGDEGTTHLVGGTRIEKSSLRMSCVGEIDELNAHLGLIRTVVQKREYSPETTNLLAKIQNDLFDIGAYLATPKDYEYADKMNTMNTEKIQVLESAIDDATSRVTELKSFVLPGGTELNSFLHIARAVCRRCERNLWQLNSEVELDKNVLVYLNRLSDLLFALSRYFIKLSDKKEYLWEFSASKS